MKRSQSGSILSRAAVLGLCLGVAWIVRGAATTGPSPADSRAQSQAQANPRVEQQRQEAEHQARQTLDQDAMAAIAETQRALRATTEGQINEALAAIERATGKISLLLARHPSTALIPVDAQVEVIDAAPRDQRVIRAIAKAAEDAVEDKDYPGARALLAGLISEIRVRTYNLPLGSYPVALTQAARLLDQKNADQAKAVLQTALNTLVVVERAIPLPLAAAKSAIDEAQALRNKDKNAAQEHLAAAKAELERARALGYAGKDPEYAELARAISDIERQLRGNEDSGSAFSKLKERIASFFKRHSESEKRSQVAGR